MPRPIRLLHLLAASCLAMTAAYGQSVDPAAAPAGPRPRPSASGEIALDEITVTSTRTESRAIDALGGVSAVTRENFDAIQPNRISDVLKQVPGVTTQENHNDPAQAINIRGLQDFGRVNVLVDGARQNFQASGHGANGVFFLDPELVGGVDITRGPVSTIYGSGAIGGVVAFRTRNIDDILRADETMGAVQTFGAGSNGAGILNSTSFGFRLPNNAANVFGQLVFRDTDPYRDGAGILIRDTGSDLRAGNFKLTVNPAEGHQLIATGLMQKFDFANNGSSNAGARFASEVNAETYTLGYRFTPTGNPLVDLSAKIYDTKTEDRRVFLADSPAGTYGALGVRPGARTSVDIDTRGFDIFNTSRFDTGPLRHALTYGGDMALDTVTSVDQAGGYNSVLTPGGRRTISGLFVQDEIRATEWLRFVGAGRYDSYSLNGNGVSASGDRISPRGTVGVSPLPWMEFFATYAEGYRAPAITETLIAGNHPFPVFTILPNQNLRPETAHNVEGGVNIKYDNLFREGDALRAKVVAFANTVDDYIDIQGVGPTFYRSVVVGAFFNGFCAGRTAPFAFCQIPIRNQQYLNIARADFSGLEAETSYDWGDGFATLAYSHTEGENARTNVTLLTTPPDKVAGTFGLRFLDRNLTVGTRVIYNDARKNFGTTAVIPNTKDFTLVDLFASYHHNDWLRADLTLSNVFDVRYIKYRDLDYSPGFQAKGALTIKFATR